MGLDLVKDNPERYISNYEETAMDLQPFALKGNDAEYAHINWSIGMYYRKAEKNYGRALIWHQKALTYNPNFAANYVGLMESNYFLKRYREAFQYSLKLIQFKYPSEIKANEIAIDCALQANLNQEALQLMQNYKSRYKSERYDQLIVDLSR